MPRSSIIRAAARLKLDSIVNTLLLLASANLTVLSPPFKPAEALLQGAIADTLGIAGDCISVKATTTEKLGFVGREEGIAAEAVCMLSKR